MEAKSIQRKKEEEEEESYFSTLPLELTLQVFEHSISSHSSQLSLFKTLRLVNKQWCEIATGLMVVQYSKCLENALQVLQTKVQEQWDTIRGDTQVKQLSEIFNKVSKISEELDFLKKKINEKKEARKSIFGMQNVDDKVKQQLLQASSFSSEFLNLRGVAESIKNGDLLLKQINPNFSRNGGGEIWHDPLRVGPPRGGFPPYGPYAPPGGFPPGGNPPFWGEPDTDHFRPPDWERDRNPPRLPGFSPAPFSPFGAPPQNDPFNPHPPHQPGPRFM